ncbi:hypothetical protein BDR04DRAFT_117003 [Suillus decipiens]|nr:hypothetical protein BDR04DRAFT_117003 [Suillus decipiens]
MMLVTLPVHHVLFSACVMKLAHPAEGGFAAFLCAFSVAVSRVSAFAMKKCLGGGRGEILGDQAARNRDGIYSGSWEFRSPVVSEPLYLNKPGYRPYIAGFL